jgi:hypothetical protein
MAWDVTAGIRVDALLTQIGTNLTDHGWTLDDGTPYFVWRSPNDHGVTQYIQITEVGTYQYLQFQAWRTWNNGTHAGTDGSGTTIHRLYFASVVVAAATLVDLYMSTTANRFIMFIKGVGNYNNWAYFGGLDALAGIADPLCAYLITAQAAASSASAGVLLQSYSSGAYWGVANVLVPCSVTSADVSTQNSMNNSILANDPTQVVAFPLLVSGGSAPYLLRGNMDGLLYVPNTYGSVSTLDTIVIGGVTYLIVQPGGQVAASTHPITSNYKDCLAIVEA